MGREVSTTCNLFTTRIQQRCSSIRLLWSVAEVHFNMGNACCDLRYLALPWPKEKKNPCCEKFQKPNRVCKATNLSGWVFRNFTYEDIVHRAGSLLRIDLQSKFLNIFEYISLRTKYIHLNIIFSERGCFWVQQKII